MLDESTLEATRDLVDGLIEIANGCPRLAQQTADDVKAFWDTMSRVLNEHDKEIDELQELTVCTDDDSVSPTTPREKQRPEDAPAVQVPLALECGKIVGPTHSNVAPSTLCQQLAAVAVSVGEWQKFPFCRR